MPQPGNIQRHQQCRENNRQTETGRNAYQIKAQQLWHVVPEHFRALYKIMPLAAALNFGWLSSRLV